MGGGPIAIEATDVNKAFLEEARAKRTRHGIPYLAQELVRYLPASSCTSFTSSQPYDAVVCMNVLCYLSEDEQRRAIWKMASHAWRYLCVTAASPAIVREGIKEAGLRPLWRNWLPIYYGWRERLSWRHRKTWKLPYVPIILPHWRYAGTSIFYRPLPSSPAT
jgi:hypothetical protein